MAKLMTLKCNFLASDGTKTLKEVQIIAKLERIRCENQIKNGMFLRVRNRLDEEKRKHGEDLLCFCDNMNMVIEDH